MCQLRDAQLVYYPTKGFVGVHIIAKPNTTFNTSINQGAHNDMLALHPGYQPVNTTIATPKGLSVRVAFAPTSIRSVGSANPPT